MLSIRRLCQQFSVASVGTFLMVTTPLLFAADTQPPASDLASRFATWLETDENLTANTKKALTAALASRVEEGAQTRDVVEALAQAYPEFDKARKELTNEKGTSAAELLKPLTTSDNPFLASNARYLLGRAHMLREDYEIAADVLTGVANESPVRTPYTAEALFHLAHCQLNMLQRDRAKETLEQFLNRASELQPPAWQVQQAATLVQMLASFREGTLVEALNLMDYSRRRLYLDRLGESTQEKQQRIVDILNKIIEQAEKGQGQGQGQGQGMGGSGPPSGNAASSPANISALPGGQASMGALGRVVRGRPEDNWGAMPPREREKALSDIKSRFPNRYRNLIEQYYKSLQETDD